MEYEIKIDEFVGPMDLLLHLIKKDDISIYDISIEKITDQYLDYIHSMEELNLNIASSYLVMAAELIELKSRVLLPKSRKEELEDNYEEDPKQNLINRLVEYQQYKEITEQFKNFEEKRREIFTKEPSSIEMPTDLVEEVDPGDVNLLLEAFQKFLERKELDKPLHTKITKKELSVSDRSKHIRQILKEKDKVSFEELFEEPTRPYIVVTFLSILDMAKKREVTIVQDHNFEQIYITKAGEEE